MRVFDQERSELPEALLSMRRIFVVVGVLPLFINALMLVPAIYMMQVYDRVLNSRNEMTLLMITSSRSGFSRCSAPWSGCARDCWCGPACAWTSG